MDVDFQNLSIDDREEEELEIQTDEVEEDPILTMIYVYYKRIPPLCYICGLIGHSENNCRVLIEVSKAEIAHAWPEEISLIGSKNCVENKYLFVPKLGKFQMPKVNFFSKTGQGCSLGGVVMQGSCMQNVTGIDGREDELLEVGEAKNVPVVHCRVLSHPEEQTFRHSSNLR
ncbi:hypothetical protein Goarm_011027 [Gossypium armourianum]|uniref:CCHC-type domain-containing protein n=1 Tax=Gossypium armourianum TaxID=34283 RepID=A0A7J9IWA1_9ROSI|nr:hypothetical protein [Gossypium armourianum]